jgi:hypothetical protein
VEIVEGRRFRDVNDELDGLERSAGICSDDLETEVENVL